MEWLYPIALRVIAAIALIYFGLGLFNVNWLLRLRIILALSTGSLLVGAVGYPLVRPADPLGAISLFTGEISVIPMLILVVLGFASGVIGTLACYPIGGVLGPFSASAGVGVLAMTSGNLRQLLLTNYTLDQRNAMYSFLRWELLFWLGVCAAGYLGSYLTTRLLGTKTIVTEPEPKLNNKPNYWINCGFSAVIAAAIVYFTIGIFAQDIRHIDEKLGFVVGHPGHRQIAFGVFVSVGLASFAAKHFLRSHYLPVILGSTLMYIITFSQFIGSDILGHIVKTWPIDFFPKSIYAILPLQYAPFSVLGAMAGFWISIYMKQKPQNEELSDNA
jgi:hypothetical protein